MQLRIVYQGGRLDGAIQDSDSDPTACAYLDRFMAGTPWPTIGAAYKMPVDPAQIGAECGEIGAHDCYRLVDDVADGDCRTLTVQAV